MVASWAAMHKDTMGEAGPRGEFQEGTAQTFVLRQQRVQQGKGHIETNIDLEALEARRMRKYVKGVHRIQPHRSRQVGPSKGLPSQVDSQMVSFQADWQYVPMSKGGRDFSVDLQGIRGRKVARLCKKLGKRCMTWHIRTPDFEPSVK